MNQPEYLGELHQAITEYQGTVRQAAEAYTDAVDRAGTVLRHRLDTAQKSFFSGNGQPHDQREVTR